MLRGHKVCRKDMLERQRWPGWQKPTRRQCVTSAQYHDFAESHKDDLATFNAAHSKEEIASVNKMIKKAMSRGVEFEKIAQQIEALLAHTSYQQKMKAFVESHKDDLATFNAAHSKEQLAVMDTMIKEAMSDVVSNNLNLVLGRSLRGGKAPLLEAARKLQTQHTRGGKCDMVTACSGGMHCAGQTLDIFGVGHCACTGGEDSWGSCKYY